MDVTNVLLIVLLVIVIIVLLQGAMVKKVGFGPFSAEFDHGDATGRDRAHRIGVVFGVLTVAATSVLVFFVARTAWPWITEHTPSLPSGMPVVPNAGAAQDDKAKTVTGRWSQRKGRLTVTVTRVDNAGGTLRLHLKAANSSSQSMFLPTGFLVATDNTERTFKAAPFGGDWAQSVPSEGSISGIIELQQKADLKATRLAMSFTEIGGLSAPQGGITVRDITIPH